mgnify:CR=1 FL=1
MCIQGEAVEAEAGCVYAARGAHVPAAKPPELCGAAAPQACRQARGAPPELRMQTGSFFRIPPLLPRLASFGRLPQAAPKEAAFYTPPGGIYGFFRSDRCFFRCNRLFFGNPLLFCPDCATLLLVKLILSAYTSVTVLCRRIERGACNEEMVEWRSCAAPQEYR